jgi:hypothetical protein
VARHAKAGAVAGRRRGARTADRSLAQYDGDTIAHHAAGAQIAADARPGASAELFRTKIKAVELEAERLQQEAMYELAGPALLGVEASSLEDAARANVAAYAAMCGGAFPQPAIETLLAALAGRGRKPEE